MPKPFLFSTSLFLAVITFCTPTAPLRAQAENHEGAQAFAAGAVMFGAARFDEAGNTAGMLGGYGYGARGRFLLGGQGVGMMIHADGARTTYGIVTAAYALRRGSHSQVYPYAGLGAGTIRNNSSSSDGGLLASAGIGADLLAGDGDPNDGGLRPALGVRVGYIARLGGNRDGAVYMALAVGLGARVHHGG